MRTFSRSLVLALVVGLPTSSAFAGVLTVGPSGATYTDIQAAVNASMSGDLVLVATGVYGPVTVDGKDVTICADIGATVTIQGTTTVKNLTATQRVVLSGLSGTGSTTALLTAEAGAGLVVANNAGLVRVESCRFEGAVGSMAGAGWGTCCSISGHDEGWDGALVRDNVMGVSFAGCTLRGGASVHVPIGCFCGTGDVGGDGLRAQATVVALYDCTLVGGHGGDNGTFGGAGGASCRTISGASTTGVFASGSTLQGGQGGDGYDGIAFAEGGVGGTGLVVGSGTSVQLLDDTLAGGIAGQSGFGVFPPAANGVPLTNAGALYTYPDTSLAMTTTSKVVQAGGHVEFRVEGNPGEVVRLVVSTSPAFQVLPSWRGVRLASLALGPVDVPLGVIAPNGVLQTRYRVPRLHAGTASRTLYVQTYRLDPVSGATLTAGYAVNIVP